MYYLFGAGVNGYGALEFWSKDSIIAFVDNYMKVGSLIEGIPVISYKEFKKKYRGEKIIVTAYLKSEEICEQLEEDGLYNFYVAPYMQSIYLNSSDIIDLLNIPIQASVAIEYDNPILEKISKDMENKGYNILVLNYKETNNESGKQVDFLLTYDRCDLKTKTVFNCKKIIDVNEEIKKYIEKKYIYLEKYKNIHQGEKCFVIGNGPSLRSEDLDVLSEKKIKCIGSNGIYKIFNDTIWRPNYYAIGDKIFYKNNVEKLPKDQKYFFRDFVPENLKNEQIIYYPVRSEKWIEEFPLFSDNLINGICGGRTITYDILQIAVYMGFKEIYLLGVDFSWGEDGRDTHFCKDYMDDEIVRCAMVLYKEEQRNAYISARRYADSHGIKIYNATRGGHLDVFERVDFDTIFE